MIADHLNDGFADPEEVTRCLNIINTTSDDAVDRGCRTLGGVLQQAGTIEFDIKVAQPD
jgi:hypothetical protein